METRSGAAGGREAPRAPPDHRAASVGRIGRGTESGRVVLVAERISKSFAGVTALRDVDFDLRRGEVHALMGENGAGKSTLMNILYGLIPADAGQIIIGASEGDDRAGFTRQAVAVRQDHVGGVEVPVQRGLAPEGGAEGEVARVAHRTLALGRLEGERAADGVGARPVACAGQPRKVML